jgi:thiamine-phosphate pyrophosphorylase
MGLVLPRLYAIIDPAQTGGRPAMSVCRELLAAGVRLIQYRDKRSSALAVFETCKDFALEIQQQGGMFFVNDRADIALAAGARGVHVGQEDLPVELARRVMGHEGWVGISTHDLDQLREADASSADYIAIGPIFETHSKENPDATVGLEGLREARKATAKPLVAIGGITVQNARSVIDAGADAVAVIHELLAAPDPASRSREFREVLGECPSAT